MFASMREGTVVDEERLNTGRGRDVEGKDVILSLCQNI